MASRDELERELALIEAMMAKGRRAAALDGGHLFGWGLLVSLLLMLQYWAEVSDWAPSDRLWQWQPAIVAGFVMSLFLGRRASGRRPANVVTRTYSAAFLSAGVAIGLFLIAAGVGGRPDPMTAVAVLTAALGCAFCVLAVATNLRWMGAVAAGWWLLMMRFAAQGTLVPSDFIVLAAASLLLLALPGLLLMRGAGR